MLTVMGGNSADMKLRQIFRFPLWYILVRVVTLVKVATLVKVVTVVKVVRLVRNEWICRIFDADQNGLISKDEVRTCVSVLSFD